MMVGVSEPRMKWRRSEIIFMVRSILGIILPLTVKMFDHWVLRIKFV
jgi:hypothetical protein